MLNKEKFAKEIVDIAVMGLSVAIKDNRPIMCGVTACSECGRFTSDRKCSKEKLLEWANSEYKEPILTEEERKYLSAVIEPFKKYVMYIAKLDFKVGWEKIVFYSHSFKTWECMTDLPPFQSGTRFKGMELNEHYYKLEELGL